jgi:hypothetical protein
VLTGFPCNFTVGMIHFLRVIRANVAQLVEHIHGGVKKTLAHNIGNDIVNPE